MRTGVGRRGLLYVGDCKLMALATRAHLAAGGNHYLAPLALTHLPQAAIDAYLQPVWAQEQALTPAYRAQPGDPPKKIAEGFECTEQLTATVAGRTFSWTERRLVVRSLQHATAAVAALQQRLARAEATIEEALLSYGVPAEWLDAVRRVTTEESLLKLADHLPKDAAETLLDLAVGVTPRIVQPVPRSHIRSIIPTRSAASGW